ncbi:MAG: glutaredoxin family protein [Nitrosomonas sp.]|nr:glutaredoxin family protein [Nitrosomonas sp.]
MDRNRGAGKLVVYGRRECHLCQQMIADLQQQQTRIVFEFGVVDIDVDPVLVARYNDKIPVLIALPDETEICHHFLNLQALDDYLAKIR